MGGDEGGVHAQRHGDQAHLGQAARREGEDEGVGRQARRGVEGEGDQQRRGDEDDGAGGIAEGVPEGFAEVPALPKFQPDGLLLAYAGGGAGLFSQIIGGWVGGDIGSKPVCRPVAY